MLVHPFSKESLLPCQSCYSCCIYLRAYQAWSALVIGPISSSRSWNQSKGRESLSLSVLNFSSNRSVSSLASLLVEAMSGVILIPDVQYRTSLSSGSESRLSRKLSAFSSVLIWLIWKRTTGGRQK
ncbi:hypothetical protein VTN96DRAFT_1951 [Rasamsonia emersonii]